MLIRLLLVGVLAAAFGFAQDEGGPPAGGGGGGPRGGGGDMGASVPRAQPSALEKMTTACNLSKEQKKQFKTILDAASKEAEGLRKQIPQGRTQILAAAQAGKGQDEIQKLVDAEGAATAQMTQIELRTFGQLYKMLDSDQRKQGAQRVFNLMIGMFMKKNWDE